MRLLTFPSMAVFFSFLKKKKKKKRLAKHTLIRPPFFFLRTILANYPGHLISSMKPTFNSLFTWTLIFSSISKWYFLASCFTGLALGLAFSLCITSLGSKPSISSYFQAKTSLYSFSKAINFLLYSSSRFLLILTNLSSPSSFKLTSISSS